MLAEFCLPFSDEDGDKLSELEVIQKELEELLVKKEKLENQGQSSQLSHPDVTPTFTETPHGGIYVLPPLQQTQEDTRLERRVATTPAAEPTTGPVVPAHLDVTPTFTETFRGGIYVLQPPQQTQEDTRLERRVATTPAAEPTTTGPVVPVNRLGRTAALTQCPSCLEVVFTKTHNTLGEAMCLLCCLSSAFGCVAGCCVIPFFMDSLKDVHHQCPQCQSHIHTFRPF